MSCSHCQGIEEQFNSKEARRMLRRFQRRGPDKSTRLLVGALEEAIRERGLTESVLLDIGAGVGAIHHELLDDGVTRAVHVDASTAHIGAAREEAHRRGHSDRVEFVRGDFVELAASVDRAAVVTLDRVICCYPDMERLVGLSASKAQVFYGAVFPRQARLVAIVIAATNLYLRIMRSTFRVFLHDPGRIDEVLRAAGLVKRSAERTFAWEIVVYERSPAVA